MADIFSTDALVAVVEDLRVPKLGLAARYFNTAIVEDSEEIHFDVDNKPRRIAPFVSPLVAGKVVASRGFAAKTFKPAYVKDKRVFHPGRSIKRAMGERIGGGELSPEDRMQILLAQDMTDQLEMIERRMEWMAAQVLANGAVTVVGDDYPSTLVDFQRSAQHTVVKGAGSRWGEAGVKPLDDLQDWSDRMVQTCGVALSDVIMPVAVWKVFRADADVKTRLDRFRGNSTMQPDAHQGEGLIYQATIDGFNIFTYSGWYVDITTGTETPFMAANQVFGVGGAALEGTRQYGAILDHDVLQAMPYYVKSWLEQDPSMRYLLMQSAPLLVPYRVNASFRATVLA